MRLRHIPSILGPSLRSPRSCILQFAPPRFEFETIIQLGEFRRILRLRCQIRYLHRQFDIALDGQQRARLRQPVQRVTQILSDRAADVRCAFDDVVQRAVLRQPFHRGFRPDFRNTWHVIDAVTDQRQVIDDALRRYAEFFLDTSDVENFIGHGVDQRDLRRHQLRDVLVAGGNHHAQSCLFGLPRQRADHVIGLDAANFQQRPAHRDNRFLQRADLRRQFIGHRRTVGLVFGVEIIAKGFALGIENAGAVLRRHILVQPAQHVEHAINGIGGFAAAVAQVANRMEGAVKIGRSVNEKQGFHAESG